MIGQFVCQMCNYPSMRCADACDNPACPANPSVSQHQKDRWKAEVDRRRAECAERERLRGIRRRAGAHW